MSKIVAIIPARYASTRFPGKPLADICGKPMIWWVYRQVKKIEELSDIFIATDDERIMSVCRELDMNVIKTSDRHPSGTDRLYEISTKIAADYYLAVNGDEPLIDPMTIRAILPTENNTKEGYVANLMTTIKDPVEVVDNTNIKVVVGDDGYAIYFSRSPIPYPKSDMEYQYHKHLGVLIYDVTALHFFVSHSKGKNEKIEDINELRFIEHHFPLKMISVDAGTLSVDTPKDLEKVRRIIAERKERF